MSLSQVDRGRVHGPDLFSTPAVEPDLPRDPRPEPHRSISQPEPPRIDTLIPQMSPIGGLDGRSVMQLPAVQNQDWSVSGEIYRKKIETLRNEVGNGWLSVLSEEGWVEAHPKMAPPHTQTVADINTFANDTDPTAAMRPSLSPVVRAHTQQAIHSGRTLG